MSDELVIIPSNGDGYVELARTKTGRLFRKHLLNLGDLRHPVTGAAVKIDDDFAAKLKKNFDDGICDIVQVPLANDKNEHTEDPARNIGEVVDVEVKDKKVYAILDIRDNDHADRLGKTYLGASAMLHLDYTDTKTGQKVGPTLLHSCVTNRPYVTGLEDYEEIVEKTVAATSDSSDGAAVLLSDNTVVEPESDIKEQDVPDEKATESATAKPSLEDLLAILKNDHNIDVSGLQAKAAEGDQAAKLSQTLVEVLSTAGVVNLSATSTQDKPSNDDIVGAVTKVATDSVALANRVQSLEKKDAENAVDTLIADGKVLPAQRDAFIELKLTNQTMFQALIPAEPIVKLNNESGSNVTDDSAHKLDVDKEIERLSALVKAK